MKRLGTSSSLTLAAGQARWLSECKLIDWYSSAELGLTAKHWATMTPTCRIGTRLRLRRHANGSNSALRASMFGGAAVVGALLFTSGIPRIQKDVLYVRHLVLRRDELLLTTGTEVRS